MSSHSGWNSSLCVSSWEESISATRIRSVDPGNLKKVLSQSVIDPKHKKDGIMMIYVEITSGILYIPYITKQFRNSVDDIARQICLYEDQKQQQEV